MASRVQFAASVTPIVTMTSDDAADHDSIGSDVGKSLGGSAYIAVGQEVHTTVGYASGTVAYGNAPANAGAKLQLGADATAYDMVFIKHTGYKYSSATVLGLATTNTLDVLVETTAGSAWQKICSIPAGGAILLPSFPTQGTSKGLWVESSSTDTIAVEYILVT